MHVDVEESSVPMLHVNSTDCSQWLLPIPAPPSWNDPCEELFFNNCTAVLIGLITLKKGPKKSKEKHLWRHIFPSQGTADIVPPRDVQDRRVTLQGPLFHFSLSYLSVFVMVVMQPLYRTTIVVTFLHKVGIFLFSIVHLTFFKGFA